MATRGQDSWAKYFAKPDKPVKLPNGAIGTQTTMKMDMTLRDANTSKVLTETIKRGTKIIVEANTHYSPQPVIYVGKKKYRVSFDAIFKPIHTAPTKKIRPSELGLSGQEYVVSRFRGEVLEAIDKRDDIDDHTKAVMKALLDWANNSKHNFDSSTLKNLKTREVVRDFGEVVAPLALLRRGILKSAGVIVGDERRARIKFPSRTNMPLIDCILEVDVSHTIISAKKGRNDKEIVSISTKTNQDRTNVVKVSEIVRLVNENSLLHDKWKQDKGYQILRLLDEHGVNEGILRAAAQLKAWNEQPFTHLEDGFENTTLETYASPQFANYFHAAPETRNTGTQDYFVMINMLEKDVVNYLNQRTQATTMFMEAVKNKVVFTTFDIVGNMPKVEVITGDKMLSRNIYFRSKNDRKRRDDKIGIQI